jgi:hypothetical protein
MNGDGDVDWPPCDAATASAPHDMLLDELRSVLPAPRAAWRIRCGRKRGDERRCIARRGRSVRRYDVTETPTMVTVMRDD